MEQKSSKHIVLLSLKTQMGRRYCLAAGSASTCLRRLLRLCRSRTDWEVHREVSSWRNGDLSGLRDVAAVLRPVRTNLIGVLAGYERGRLKLTDGPLRLRYRAVHADFGVGRHPDRDMSNGVRLRRCGVRARGRRWLDYLIPAGIRGRDASVGVRVSHVRVRAIPEVVGRVVA